MSLKEKHKLACRYLEYFEIAKNLEGCPSEALPQRNYMKIASYVRDTEKVQYPSRPIAPA
jgi:hypothetical protein